MNEPTSDDDLSPETEASMFYYSTITMLGRIYDLLMFDMQEKYGRETMQKMRKLHEEHKFWVPPPFMGPMEEGDPNADPS